MRRFALHMLTLAAVLLFSLDAAAQLNREEPEALQGLEIEEHLGEFIPMDARFATSKGDSVAIGDLFIDNKPVILNPLYYDCPMLCGLVLDGMVNAAEELKWKPGEDYIVISLSIDPEEDVQVAAKSKNEMLTAFDKKYTDEGWYFLTGNKKNIDRVVDAVGFKYKEIENTGEYAHSAAIMMLSPQGKVTRYLYGIEYDEFNVRSALYEAADGEIGNTLTKVVMYCYQYDPDADSYVPVAFNIMKIGGLATLIFLGIFVGLLWLREKRKNTTTKTDFY